MDSYGQFCPIALASEVVTRRWMPLVIRELLLGSVRFNDIHRGVPRISRSLLARRLAALERAGLVQRCIVGDDAHPEYHLTEAGEELRPIIMQLGMWGKRWMRSELSREHLDVGLLMWDVRRRVVRERLPARRIVICFHFTDAPKGYQHFWLVLDGRSADLCLHDPGFSCDLEVTSDVRTMVDVWMGDLALAHALQRETLRISGPTALRRQFPGWLGLNLRAPVERVR